MPRDGGEQDLPDLLTAAERMGFDGLNITHPCKQTVLPLLHELSDDARAIGAVNTVVLRDGKRIVGASRDGKARVWDVSAFAPDAPDPHAAPASLEAVLVLDHGHDPVTVARFVDAAGRKVVTGTGDLVVSKAATSINSVRQVQECLSPSGARCRRSRK